MGIYSNKRKSKILEIINDKDNVTNKEISEILDLSAETIRRYLSELEAEGKIKRTHGGALKIDSYNNEGEIGKRLSIMEKEKSKIAKEAARLIENGDKIIIDEGSTTCKIVKYLEGKKDLVIITSSFLVAAEVMNLINNNKLKAELIFLGGLVQSSNKRTVGSYAINMVDKFLVDKAFISCEGISIYYGITAYDEDKSELSRKFINQAKENIILADYSKVEVRNYYKISELIKINRIISNKDMPKEWANNLNSWNIQWHTT